MGGSGERGHGQATGGAFRLERAGQRGRHDAQALGEVVVVPAGQYCRTTSGAICEADKRLPPGVVAAKSECQRGAGIANGCESGGMWDPIGGALPAAKALAAAATSRASTAQTTTNRLIT